MPRYRMKEGMGRHNIRTDDGVRPIVPGDEIKCEEFELGGALDKFECLDPPSAGPIPNVGLVKVPLGRGWFNVVNEVSEEKINDKALREADADELIEMAALGLDEAPIVIEQGEEPKAEDE